jgi:hypothetical protein
MMMKTLLATAGLVLSVAVSPALAQQEGLVNVNVEGVAVQVPVGIAAQVCGVDANVLADQFVGTENVVCDIDQQTAAQHNIGPQGQGGGQGGGQQEGLVNVNVEDVTVQVPIGVAAQVCGIDANVIAEQFVGSENVVCDIDQETAAQHNIGPQGQGGGQGQGQGQGGGG